MLTPGAVVVDPSRVAAQIVSGIGFLGAGLIITRRGAVHGLTTAAAVWETAAIGMAAGAGLLLLGLTPLARRLANRIRGSVRLHITYRDGRGVLHRLLDACEQHSWQLSAPSGCSPRSTVSPRSVGSRMRTNSQRWAP